MLFFAAHMKQTAAFYESNYKHFIAMVQTTNIIFYLLGKTTLVKWSSNIT